MKSSSNAAEKSKIDSSMKKLAGSIVSNAKSSSILKSKELQIKSLRKNLSKSLEDHKLNKTTFLTEKPATLRFGVSANSTNDSVSKKSEASSPIVQLKPSNSRTESSPNPKNALSLLSSAYDDDEEDQEPNDVSSNHQSTNQT